MSDPVTLTIKFTRPDGLVANAHADPGKSVLLGRDLSCDVRLDGRKVSRRHLSIQNRERQQQCQCGMRNGECGSLGNLQYFS